MIEYRWKAAGNQFFSSSTVLTQLFEFKMEFPYPWWIFSTSRIMEKKRISTDRILGLMAMLVGLLTLIFFIYQTNIMRAQSRLEVKPRLSFRFNSEENDSEMKFSLRLINKGIGPAIIESAFVNEANSNSFESFEKFLTDIHPQILALGELSQNATLSKGDVISANEAFSFYTFVVEREKLPELMKYLGTTEKITYPWTTTVVYSSMYEEKWKVTDKLRDHPIVLED